MPDHPNISFKNVDEAEIEDVLGLIARSFNISITDEVAHVKTFGALCDIIAAKITLYPAYDCTSQQAFYKVRAALALVLDKENAAIKPSALLRDLLPWKNRRATVAALEKELGFQLKILKPGSWLFNVAWLYFLLGWVLVFANLFYGLAAVISAVIALKLLTLFGKELRINTVAELAEKMASEHNVQSRRDPSTYNRTEVEPVIRHLFAEHLRMDESLFIREATFS